MGTFFYLNSMRSFLKINYIFRILRILKNYIIGKKEEPFPTRPYIFTQEDADKVSRVVLSGNLHHTAGTEVASLEKEFALYHDVKYALATNAGTSALELGLKAIGLKPGDEVIVPAFTFVATAQAVLSRGCIPIFADIDDTFTISPESLERVITERTKAVIPVHIFGNVANIERITQIAKKHKLFVVEDACQAVGAQIKDRKVGSWGDVGCFSFNEKKAISTGQGGMLITSKKKYYDIAFITRDTGQAREEIGSDVVTIGNTFAMTEMQAALARSILEKLDDLNAKRRSNYELFVELMETGALPLHWYRTLPSSAPSFSRLVFMIDFKKLDISRKEFIGKMHAAGLPMKTFYPAPLYAYSLFRKKKDMLLKSNFPFSFSPHLKYPKKLPYVELFCQQQIGLEFSPYITREHITRLCNVLRRELLAHLI